ncbi:glycoside hydrolase family 15 protein [Actinomycetospora sp. NBRC 106378]|uniref:glycoside hydrolase family 15 protein n=1 Tax=Actinomycetospora sp. NBRC 106378 TaxID=3032208 RepID=UPI0025529F3A|nr:glycoside hydrolase family 15 protein [Actinomycetospora sp. NBRC 106378]
MLAIEDHGVIGDLRTVALVGTDGSIDFACLPDFDSPAVFSALLTEEGAAAERSTFTVRPGSCTRTKQLYLPDSNVLMTRFLDADSVAEVVDLMDPEDDGTRPLVRTVRVVRGRQSFTVRCAPAFDWGRVRHSVELLEGVGAVFLPSDDSAGSGCLVLRTSAALRVADDPEATGPAVVAEIDLGAGEAADFLLTWHDEAPHRNDVDVLGEHEADRRRDAVLAYWQQWLARSTYAGRWREMVHRSALLLKLMVHRPTGALIAAPTAGLPEEIGGERNWDYRYAWLRDAAFTSYALMRLGFVEEGRAFLSWLEQRMAEADDESGLLPVYTVHGAPPPEEVELTHLSGYRGSRPVRIGNAAGSQRQLDTYGEVMDSVYIANKETPISYDLWTRVRGSLDWLDRNRHLPDQGLWESRGEPQFHTYSRVMVWVAFERALRLARQRGLPAPVEAWEKAAAEAYEEVQRDCWDGDLGTYTQFPGTDQVEAGLLILPLVKFSGPTDPRFLSTLQRIESDLVVDSLVQRYPPDGSDGLDGGEGTFNLCSFWYVEALTRSGRLDRARNVLEKAFTYANHVGLFAEELSASGEQLGNFPQALTHLGLISAAVNLDRALG